MATAALDESAVQTAMQALGERIVSAARLAVSAHLFESLAAASGNYGQQVVIGGAGPVVPATADRAHPRRPFRIPGDAACGADARDGGEPGAGSK